MNVHRLAPWMLLLALPAAAAEKPQINVQEVTLGNGMRFLLFEHHESPTVAAGWMAHVGSVNERPGITGISHFFEHMMFKGTHVIGTKDIKSDLEIIEEQERVREEMRKELEVMRARLRRGEIPDLSSPESQTEKYRELDKKFDALVQRQRENIVKDHMDQIYTSNGGEFLNASTNEDSTNYFLRLPRNRLELWAWLESDRLLNPVFREFYSERDVVFEERRLRTESTPLGKYDESFNATFWDASPYTWPVVGWASDIPSYTLAQAKDYFATYYAPNNLTGVLVGDFSTAEVKPLLERYFGRLPAGKTPPPPVVTMEPAQLAEKRFRAEAETSPTVRIWWHGVPFVHKDRTALDLLTDVLSGRTGRLYKGLVLGKQVANEAGASVDFKRYDGSIQLEAVVKDGKEPRAVEEAVDEEVARLSKEDLPAEELQKVKNQAKANAYRRLSSPTFIMFQLLIYEGLGDWRYINTYADEVDRVTAADIRRVAAEHMTRENRTVGVFTRKQGTAPEDPEVAALVPQAQAIARQGLQQLQAETDAEKLRQGLAQLEQGMGGAPAEVKSALELILKRGRERLAALESGKK
ncbi:MAG TPA: pitrilysin family protein [Vicinamibacteria bacterium]|nr:pitrilysin family protein [Vicinamibacteria bacterium]